MCAGELSDDLQDRGEVSVAQPDGVVLPIGRAQRTFGQAPRRNSSPFEELRTDIALCVGNDVATQRGKLLFPQAGFGGNARQQLRPPAPVHPLAFPVVDLVIIGGQLHQAPVSQVDCGQEAGDGRARLLERFPPQVLPLPASGHRREPSDSIGIPDNDVGTIGKAFQGLQVADGFRDAQPALYQVPARGGEVAQEYNTAASAHRAADVRPAPGSSPAVSPARRR